MADKECEYYKNTGYWSPCSNHAVARQIFKVKSNTADMGGFYDDISYTWNVCSRHLDPTQEAHVASTTTAVHQPRAAAVEK